MTKKGTIMNNAINIPQDFFFFFFLSLVLLVVLAGLLLTMYPRLVLTLQQSSCLSFQNAGIEGLYH